MKRSFLLLNLTLVVALLSGCAALSGSSAKSMPDAAEAAEVIDAPEFVLYARGLSCPLCSHNLDKSMLEVEAIESVEVNLADGSVKVWLKPGQSVTVGQLADVVAGSGFTFDRVEVPGDS
ncbi:heavy-metal-associated domain-containing protein [Mucisphaera sp.]|uniref:heavy-metal-associated domain-containing protein n=1 Tax=Mucisphaera sp. TaxID=2913024 RepID=UPI003D11F2A3